MSHHGHHGYPLTKQMRSERRKFAEERQAEYDKLTLQQKIDRLPAEPAAAKQRARLLRLLEESKKPKPEVKEKPKADVAASTTAAEVERSFNKKSYKRKVNQ